MIPLFDNYTLRILTQEQLKELHTLMYADMFADTLIFRSRAAMTEAERASQDQIADSMNAYTLRLGVYCGEQVIGWHVGGQDSAEEFYMRNTAIVPEHRGRGIYTAMLPHILQDARQAGFQIVHSLHQCTNNQVIVPKLKAGFIITGFKISDKYGLLVNLSYYFNPLRRRAMDFRAGLAAPDEELRKYLNLG